MESIIVQLPAAPGSGTPASLQLGPGAEASFGRDPAADVVLADPRVPRLAGRIRAVDNYWLASNLTCSHTFVVENPESAGEYVKLPPRRLDLPVPFEFARVVVASASFLVFAPQHAYVDAASGVSDAGEATVSAFPLDESAKYFLILVALCEPRLRDPDSLVLPTAAEVIARLAPLPHCAELTRAAVNFQVDYLARTKLRVRTPEPDPAASCSKADWQREALVRTALRFDLVREEHLGLLP